MSTADLYALACLAGGPERAVDTAVVTLLLDGRLRAEETGALGTMALRYGHPVEAAVLDAVLAAIDDDQDPTNHHEGAAS